jgi:hypothetical protein
MPDYIVKITAGETTRERIVRAKNRAQAVNHVVGDSLKVDVASIDDAVRITQAGGKVEQASEGA